MHDASEVVHETCPDDVPVMVCEDVHTMLMKGALLQHDVNYLSQKQSAATLQSTPSGHTISSEHAVII